MDRPLQRPQELVAASLDYIAQEGRGGVAVAVLLDAVDPTRDACLRRHLWHLLRRPRWQHVLCFASGRSSAVADSKDGGRVSLPSKRGAVRAVPGSETAFPRSPSSKKRKRPVSGSDQSSGSAKSGAEAADSQGDEAKSDSLPEMSASYSDLEVLKRIDDSSAGGVIEAKPSTDTAVIPDAAPPVTIAAHDIEALSLETAIEMRVIVIACEELRFRALNLPVKAVLSDFSDEHFAILEQVGRSRIQGMTVTDLANQCVGGSVKRLHNALDMLISYRLVVKRMMIVGKPIMRRLNIVHLPCFAMAFTPQMFDPSAEFESDEQSKKILSAVAEKYLQQLPTQSSVLTDLGRDLCLQKRHLEILRTHIIQESKRNENFRLELFQAVLQPSKKSSIEPKILNCVRYRPVGDWLYSRHPNSFRRGIQIEGGLLQQIHRLIQETGEHGATITEMRNQITIPGSKLPYKLVRQLAGSYELKAQTIILGKNKAFRLYINSNRVPDPDLPENAQGVSTSAIDATAQDTSAADPASLRDTRALKGALWGSDMDGTRELRRQHILQRISEEKIISLSSLRASIFSMEKTAMKESQAAMGLLGSNSMLPPSAVGMVDIRSISRIAAELEVEGQCRLLQLPLPARNVSTKFRALRCVMLPGYETNESFIQDYVKNYCRDERLRRVSQNMERSQVVQLHGVESGDDDDVKTARKGDAQKQRQLRLKRKRPSGISTELQDQQSAGERNASNGPTQHELDMQGERIGPNEISYRIRHFVHESKSRAHALQYRKLGFAYGVMYRCKVFHRFLWNFLHENKNMGFDNDPNGMSIDEDDDDDGAQSGSEGSARNRRCIVFSRETVLHAMPVNLYIQAFSGGSVLLANEMVLVEDAVKHQRPFDALPAAVQAKIWSHESERTAKVLGTLSDLNLIAPHKIGMQNLIKILRAGYTDDKDGVLTRALKDNALGGLFRMNRELRIVLDDIDNRGASLSEQDHQPRKTVNDSPAIRILGTTEKHYSFGNMLPLSIVLESMTDVERYWEALECLCLEQMVMEVSKPRRNEPAVREVPKPVKTRARRMLKILAWIQKSRKLPPKPAKVVSEEKKASANTDKRNGIVSKKISTRKRRRAPTKNQTSDDSTHNSSSLPHRTSKKQRAAAAAAAALSSKDADGDDKHWFHWTDEHEQKLLEYFIENGKTRWKISIPQGLQRDSEQVAFRNPTLSRSGFGLVAIARKLGKRNIDVKKRLKEKLLEPAAKLTFELAKQEAIDEGNPGGVFDEEVAIIESSRLTALFRRAVMMIVSPQEEYHPLVAEELISFWTAHEIRLVWRYLWLKNWIVRATDAERRGYTMSQRLQDSLKLTALSYPLVLFRQAAEQEAMIRSTLDEMTIDHAAGNNMSRRRLSSESMNGYLQTQEACLFEADFPTNATPGQCALELGGQVMGTCSLSARHTRAVDDHGWVELDQDDDHPTQSPVRKRNLRFLQCKSLREGSGFAAHLAKHVPFKRPSSLIDSWQVEIKAHAAAIEDRDQLRELEAFSLVDDEDYDGIGTVAFRPFKRHKKNKELLEQKVMQLIKTSGERGLTLPELMVQLDSSEARLVSVGRCLNTLVDEGTLLCVNAYFNQRFITKEHGDLWLLRPFSLVTTVGNSSSSNGDASRNSTTAATASAAKTPAPVVIFEGEKDTLSFPWLKMDGSTNYKFLFAIQRKLLAFILMAPGVTEAIIFTKMEKLLSMQDIREALSLLVEEGLVYTRAMATTASSLKTKKRSLFAKPSDVRVVNLVGNVLAYDRTQLIVHYFPHIECIQRFGSIVQDYQNEVAEFHRS